MGASGTQEGGVGQARRDDANYEMNSKEVRREA
jgi:hypothetical protein